MLHRATERWDANDDHAVFLQASLFSYQSVEHEQSNEDVALELECDLERRREALHPKQAQRQHTQLPVEPLGAPSELRRCFEAVNSAIAVPPSKSRVRARLCTSANADISVQHVTLVWLTVEDKVGKPALILRWGRRARRNGCASALHLAHRSARGDAEGTLEGLQRISLCQV
jgi:hypothetical protein